MRCVLSLTHPSHTHCDTHALNLCAHTCSPFTHAHTWCVHTFAGSGVKKCTPGVDNCVVNAACTNIVNGSFICACKSGYFGDGTTCTDEDECTLGLHNCDANADCTNTDGSFTCACKSGYFGDGINCLFLCTCMRKCILMCSCMCTCICMLHVFLRCFHGAYHNGNRQAVCRNNTNTYEMCMNVHVKHR